MSYYTQTILQEICRAGINNRDDTESALRKVNGIKYSTGSMKVFNKIKAFITVHWDRERCVFKNTDVHMYAGVPTKKDPVRAVKVTTPKGKFLLIAGEFYGRCNCCNGRVLEDHSYCPHCGTKVVIDKHNEHYHSLREKQLSDKIARDTDSRRWSTPGYGYPKGYGIGNSGSRGPSWESNRGEGSREGSKGWSYMDLTPSYKGRFDLIHSSLQVPGEMRAGAWTFKVDDRIIFVTATGTNLIGTIQSFVKGDKGKADEILMVVGDGKNVIYNFKKYGPFRVISPAGPKKHPKGHLTKDEVAIYMADTKEASGFWGTLLSLGPMAWGWIKDTLPSKEKIIEKLSLLKSWDKFKAADMTTKLGLTGGVVAAMVILGFLIKKGHTYYINRKKVDKAVEKGAIKASYDLIDEIDAEYNAYITGSINTSKMKALSFGDVGDWLKGVKKSIKAKWDSIKDKPIPFKTFMVAVGCGALSASLGTRLQQYLKNKKVLEIVAGGKKVKVNVSISDKDMIKNIEDFVKSLKDIDLKNLPGMGMMGSSFLQANDNDIVFNEDGILVTQRDIDKAAENILNYTP